MQVVIHGRSRVTALYGDDIEVDAVLSADDLTVAAAVAEAVRQIPAPVVSIEFDDEEPGLAYVYVATNVDSTEVDERVWKSLFRHGVNVVEVYAETRRDDPDDEEEWRLVVTWRCWTGTG